MAVPYEMLLHPELLNNEQLISIIRERYIHISDLEFKRRDELLELFHNYCVPYGQRKYRDSGRGRVLNLARKTSPEPVFILPAVENCIFKTNMPSSKSERLKPPPELLPGNIKRIKLDITTHPILSSHLDIQKPRNDIPLLLDHMKRKMDYMLPTDGPPHKKDKKLITWP